MENLIEKIEHLYDEIDHLKKTIYEGNGHKPLLVRVSQLENDLPNIKDTLEIKMDKMEGSFNAKLKQLEASIENKLQKSDAKYDISVTQINNSIENLSKELKLDYGTMVAGLEQLNDKYKEYEEHSNKTKIAWLAFFSSIIAAFISVGHLWIK